MRWIRTFFRFWYDFIVGDDWRIALGVVIAIAVTMVLSHTTDAPTWWIIVAAVAGLLALSIRRAAAARRH
jgi:hypothetical protein